MREVIRLVREATSGPDGIDGGLVMWWQAIRLRRTGRPLSSRASPSLPPHPASRTREAVIDAIEAGTSDDATSLAAHAIGPVGALAEATLAHFKPTPTSVRDLRRELGPDPQTAVSTRSGRTRPAAFPRRDRPDRGSAATPATTCR